MSAVRDDAASNEANRGVRFGCGNDNHRRTAGSSALTRVPIVSASSVAFAGTAFTAVRAVITGRSHVSTGGTTHRVVAGATAGEDTPRAE